MLHFCIVVYCFFFLCLGFYKCTLYTHIFMHKYAAKHCLSRPGTLSLVNLMVISGIGGPPRSLPSIPKGSFQAYLMSPKKQFTGSEKKIFAAG